jgi:uncharacterized membrane protein YedE/YeeE
MTALLGSFIAGLVFAVGLGVSGMTQPAKIIGFLDVFSGRWDPSLALVMAGAIGVHLPFHRWLRARAGARPVTVGCAMPGDPPPDRRRLIGGAALFGAGWGLGGYCPGPAVVSLASAGTDVFLFVGAMAAGMLLHDLTGRRSTDENVLSLAGGAKHA